MIRNTEEFLAALRAARRASTPLVSIRTADPASAIALTTRSLNGDADGTSLLSWDIMTGLSAVNGPGKKMLDSIIGERNPETVGPADALSVAVKLGDDAVTGTENADAGLPVRTAMACSSCARRTSRWVAAA